MTAHPQSPVPEPADSVDLDDIFRDSTPVEDLDELAIPGFFENDEEFDAFQTWLRAQRAAGIA